MYTKITYSAAIATKVKDLRIGKKKNRNKNQENISQKRKSDSKLV